MEERDLIDLETCDTRPPDVTFSSEFDGNPYDVIGWSVSDKIVLGLPKYGTFGSLVKALKPGISPDDTSCLVQVEACKCVKKAGKLLSQPGRRGVLNE